jgi:hypothetical protein
MEVILGVNSVVLSDLEKKLSKWNSSQLLGDIFLQIVIGFLPL